MDTDVGTNNDMKTFKYNQLQLFSTPNMVFTAVFTFALGHQSCHSVYTFIHAYVEDHAVDIIVNYSDLHMF